MVEDGMKDAEMISEIREWLRLDDADHEVVTRALRVLHQIARYTKEGTYYPPQMPYVGHQGSVDIRVR